MLAPIVPHICHHLWDALGHNEIIATVKWPLFDESALTQNSVELVIQVNGKLRGKLSVAIDAETALIEALALQDEHVQKFMEGKPPKKIIVVPKKLVNIVV